MALEQTTIPQNVLPSEPSLKDVLNQFQKNLLLHLNCHHLGTIQSFLPETQQATVTINYKKTFFIPDSITGIISPKLVEYPILAYCPVIFLGGGTGAITFPVEEGDECLVLFNDRDLDNWFAGGSGSPNATARLHSFADGIVLVGIRSLANVLVNFDTERVSMRGDELGLTVVSVGETLIKIANSTTTLNTLLQSLITNIQNLVTATSQITVEAGLLVAPPSGGPVTGTSGLPVNASTISNINTQLMTLSNQIAGLLE